MSAPSSPVSPASPHSRRGFNPNTQLPWDRRSPVLGLTALADAYTTARAIAVALPPMALPGYRLFWMDGPRLECRELAASRGAHLVVGRHSCCDVVLDDPAIALRHLLLRAEPEVDGPGAVRVLDLCTATGFHLEHDGPVRSTRMAGPSALRVGRCAVIAIPSGGPPPEALPRARVEHVSPEDWLPAVVGPSPYRRAPRRGAISSVDILPPSVPITSRFACLAPVGRLRLERGGASAEVVLDEQALARGVLIGRAERCEERLRHLLSCAISRVHLLVIAEPEGIIAYDLASLNGTIAPWAGAVRRVCLASGLSLLLGNEVTVSWFSA